MLLALMASSTPTPLYSIYAAEWHFSPLTVTEVYAVYAIGVLVALLLTGGLSDLIGRRPVMITALLGLVGAEVIFMFAGGLEWLYVARSIQGLATGLLLGATGAALVDLHPRRDGGQAGLVNGIASAAGIGLGALVSGLLVQYARYPEVTPFVVIAVLAPLGGLRRMAAARDGRRARRPPDADPADSARTPRRCGARSRSRPSACWRPGRSAASTSRSARRSSPSCTRRPEPRGRRHVRVRGLRLRHARAVDAAQHRDTADLVGGAAPAGASAA